jgi:Tfp pilus assembly protein PilN
MTWRMVASPFEFAPDAARYLPLNWAILAVGLSTALAGVYMVREAKQSLDAVQTQQTRLLRQQKTYAEQAQLAARHPLTLERFKAQRQLENLLQAPWSQLFDALEVAADVVEGRVTLLSVSPSYSQAGPVSRRVELTLAASSYASMLAYMDAMKEVAGFSDVRISSHQMDERIGPTAIRFRVTAGWNQLKEGVFLARDPAIAPDAGAGNVANPTNKLLPLDASRVADRSPSTSAKAGLSR